MVIPEASTRGDRPIELSGRDAALTSWRTDNDTVVQAFDFDTIKLFDQIGEQIVIL